MLSGGNTPLEAYRTLARSPVPASDSLLFLFSDERMVPSDSPDSNYHNAAPMIAALGIPGNHVIRVHTELGLSEAAQRYHDDLGKFLQKGGRITLGLLGLGADGHTASIFSKDDIDRCRARWATEVPRDDGPDRVTVTPELLKRIESVIFLVAGPEKADVAETLAREPETLPAGRAVAGVKDVQLWASGAS